MPTSTDLAGGVTNAGGADDQETTLVSCLIQLLGMGMTTHTATDHACKPTKTRLIC